MSAKKTAGKEKKPGVFGVFFRLLPDVFSATPALTLLCWGLSILHAAAWSVEVIMKQRFFDSASGLAEGSFPVAGVFLALVFLILASAGAQVLNGVANFLPNLMFSKAMGKLSMKIQKKIASLDPAVFEDTEKLDQINKAEQGKNNAVYFVFMFGLLFNFYLPYFFFMGRYLFSLKPILALSILIVFLPTAAVQVIRSKLFAKLEDKSAPVRREHEYYELCIASREYFKETRLLGGFAYFRALALDALDRLQKLRYRAQMRSNFFELGARMLTVGGYFGIMYLLFDALMAREITVGSFAAVFASIGTLYSITEEVVTRHFSQMARDLGSIQNYTALMKMPGRTGTVTAPPAWGDIELRDVSFAYPGAEKRAVKNVSFTLKKGETIAIVGENGSGKSTLIRLITGLYLPTEGAVFTNGTDSRELAPEALFARSSAVFQKYQRYQMTLAENIRISDEGEEADPERLDAVCEMAGARADDPAFPKGYDTMLSREFDGVDLSGGQWQRVAIARGFFRSHDTIVLDEPTAAIDPFEETRVYNRFAKISKDKSAIIVTHRLGSVRLADRIVVLKDGEVAQIGTHDELIAADGEYARLYRAQEQWYAEKTAPAGV